MLSAAPFRLDCVTIWRDLMRCSKFAIRATDSKIVVRNRRMKICLCIFVSRRRNWVNDIGRSRTRAIIECSVHFACVRNGEYAKARQRTLREEMHDDCLHVKNEKGESTTKTNCWFDEQSFTKESCVGAEHLSDAMEDYRFSSIVSCQNFNLGNSVSCAIPFFNSDTEYQNAIIEWE